MVKQLNTRERKAWDEANILWIELDLVAKRISLAGPKGMAHWSADEHEHIMRTLKRAARLLNLAKLGAEL